MLHLYLHSRWRWGGGKRWRGRYPWSSGGRAGRGRQVSGRGRGLGGDHRGGRGGGSATSSASAGIYQLETELKEELFGLPVPVGPESGLGLVHLPRWHFESDSLVRLCGKHEVLPLSVRGLHLLLIGGHEAVPGAHALRDLGVVYLKQEALLAIVRIPLLGHSVAWPPDLNELLDVDTRLKGSRLDRGVLGLLGGSPGEVALMLLALGVSQVGGLIVMQGQTQFTLECPQMISHEVGVLKHKTISTLIPNSILDHKAYLGEVDGLRGQGGEPLPPVPVGLGV